MNNLIFYDLNKVFISEPIVIKGAFDFSLKSIAKSLFNNNLIKSSWDTSSICSNGLDAMYLANQYYKNMNPEIGVMKDILYYNEIDCKVLWEIHELIKKI